MSTQCARVCKHACKNPRAESLSTPYTQAALDRQSSQLASILNALSEGRSATAPASRSNASFIEKNFDNEKVKTPPPSTPIGGMKYGAGESASLGGRLSAWAVSLSSLNTRTGWPSSGTQEASAPHSSGFENSNCNGEGIGSGGCGSGGVGDDYQTSSYACRDCIISHQLDANENTAALSKQASASAAASATQPTLCLKAKTQVSDVDCAPMPQQDPQCSPSRFVSNQSSSEGGVGGVGGLSELLSSLPALWPSNDQSTEPAGGELLSGADGRFSIWTRPGPVEPAALFSPSTGSHTGIRDNTEAGEHKSLQQQPQLSQPRWHSY